MSRRPRPWGSGPSRSTAWTESDGDCNMKDYSRAQIRPYRLDDAAMVYEAVRESMAELSPWMPWCHPAYSLQESRNWLEIQVPAFEQRTAFEFAIVTSDGRYLGGCGLN